MKRILDDYKNEHFSLHEIVIYGIAMPAAFCLLVGIISYLFSNELSILPSLQ